MKLFATIAFALVIPTHAADPRGDHPDSKPSTPEQQRAMFHLPPGFEIQLVASEPEIQKPLNLTFDAAGRLWVTGSEMYPWPAGTDAQGQPIPDFAKAYDAIADAFGARGKAPAPSGHARDTVRVLSDFDETGRAKKITVFADGLNIPSGVQPLPRKPAAKGDTVIVYSIPNIYRLEDTDGDGRADTREVLYGSAGFLDTHGGMSSFLHWIDGWIYGTHGFRNHSEIRDQSGRLTILDSGNTYRFRPDGSAFEIYTHGQTNPFGLTVDPLGNFYSADSHSKPVYMLLRGGHYEGIGKQHDGLGFAPRITDDDHGSTAIAGIAYYAAEQFPEEFRGNLFNGNPVTRRINRDKLEWHGSTPMAIRQPDFLTCDDPWFRPVQVKLGPDGALYIADFYNPIIGHYEFPLADPRRDHSHGRIWRIVYRGEKSVPPMPDLSELAADRLVEKLADPNLTVRTLATNELVDRLGKPAVPAMEEHLQAHSEVPEFIGSAVMPEALGAVFDADEKTRRTGRTLASAHCYWALGRLGIRASNDIETDGFVLFHENKSSDALFPSELRSFDYYSEGVPASLIRAAVEGLQSPLEPEDEDRRLIRFSELCSALGRAAPDDLQLIHAIRIAMRDHLRKPGAYSALALAIQLSPSDLEHIAEVSLAVPTAESAAFLMTYLQRTRLEGARSGEFLRHTVLHLPPDRLEAIAGLIENLSNKPIGRQLDIADHLTQAYRQRGLSLPDAVIAWTQRTQLDALATTDDGMLARAIEGLRETKLDAKVEPLGKIAADPRRSDALRAAALGALANLPGSRDRIWQALRDPSSMALRKKAVDFFNGHLGTPERDLLLETLPTAPGELATAIAAQLATTDASCADLIAIIEGGKASPGLLRNTLVAAALEQRAAPLRDRAAALTKDLPAEDARLDQLIATRVADYNKGQHDAVRGAQVFTQQCAICHQLKNRGANLGPALDGIGARGLHRLTEDILDPNRNVDPVFRQTLVETTAGQILAGVNIREEGELLVLTDATGKPVSVAKRSVKSRTTSKLSLMPAAFETAIPTADFNDLLAFLLGSQ
jgi:putative heme-binding domain-containing protein